jgi:hypothetical protein
MEEGNVQDHGGQGQQANEIQLFHGVCPFFEMFRENRALDGRFQPTTAAALTPLGLLTASC